MPLMPLSQLKRAVRDALAYLRTQPDIAEAGVFASANGNLTVRLNYTSRIPSNVPSFDDFCSAVRRIDNSYPPC